KAHWQAIDPQTVALEQATADFYQQQWLIARPLRVEPTFYRGITVEAGQRLACRYFSAGAYFCRGLVRSSN
ncbi:hypothetical protein QCD69_22780, partial [Erwinia sp. PsM31]|nr:hypothetical protein [Erwinia sp. PsM31]